MNNGKILWDKLKIIHTHWSADVKDGQIDIHIPIVLYVPYDPMNELPWTIRKTIYNQLLKLKWPVEGLDNLYYFYYSDSFNLRILTHKKSTVDFYNLLKNKFWRNFICSLHGKGLSINYKKE